MRRISEESLANVALHYLQRYSSSTKRLREVLTRRVKNHLRLKGGEPVDAGPMIDKIVERMVKAGYVDDARLAESKAASLHRAGKSARMIKLKLRQHGLDGSKVQSDTEHELEAALTLGKKKKIGRDPERKQKDLAVLMRGGFSYSIAKTVLAQLSSTRTS
jgi:regulatory protein